MKKLSTISLIIFCIIVTALLTAGLVFYQNKKNTTTVIKNTSQNSTPNTNIPNTSNILDMVEIAKHSTEKDCWLLISGKIYDITSYFGSHPGGNGKMAVTCGIDATAAYATQNPSAKNSFGRSAHSSNAINMLSNYYIGDLNQVIK